MPPKKCEEHEEENCQTCATAPNLMKDKLEKLLDEVIIHAKANSDDTDYHKTELIKFIKDNYYKNDWDNFKKKYGKAILK